LCSCFICATHRVHQIIKEALTKKLTEEGYKELELRQIKKQAMMAAREKFEQQNEPIVEENETKNTFERLSINENEKEGIKRGGKIVEDIFNHLAENKSVFEGLDDEQTIKKADALIADYIENNLINDFTKYLIKEYNDFKYLDKGGESTAYTVVNDEGNKVVAKHSKVKYGLFKSLINKIVLQNAIYPNIPYVLKGFMKENGKYKFVFTIVR
jgi:hypothetical protein